VKKRQSSPACDEPTLMTALLDAFNKALRQIRADGTFKPIND